MREEVREVRRWRGGEEVVREVREKRALEREMAFILHMLMYVYRCV